MTTDRLLSMQRRSAAHASWANTSNPTARTAPGRAAFSARFERQVDPDGVLPVEERRRRAKHAQQAYMQDLAVRSAKKRAANKAYEDLKQRTNPRRRTA